MIIAREVSLSKWFEKRFFEKVFLKKSVFENKCFLPEKRAAHPMSDVPPLFRMLTDKNQLLCFSLYSATIFQMRSAVSSRSLRELSWLSVSMI